MWKCEVFTDQEPQQICPIIKCHYLGNSFLKRINIAVNLHQSPDSLIKVIQPPDFFLICIFDNESDEIRDKLIDIIVKFNNLKNTENKSLFAYCFIEIPQLEYVGQSEKQQEAYIIKKNLGKWSEIINFFAIHLTNEVIDEY